MKDHFIITSDFVLGLCSATVERQNRSQFKGSKKLFIFLFSFFRRFILFSLFSRFLCICGNFSRWN